MNKELIFTFIKKNMLSLICGLVAALCIGAIFYPLGGMVSDLQGESDNHAGDFGTLTNYIKQRNLPISSPDQTDTGTLANFPNQNDIKAGNDAVDRWTRYSKQMLDDVTAMNQKGHDLLVPNELPNPGSESTTFLFAKLYTLVLSTDPAVTSKGDPTANPPIPPNPALADHQNIQNDILNGGLPPTLDEIKKASMDLYKNDFEPMVIERNGIPTNKEEIDAKYSAAAALLPLKLKGDAAKKHKMYVEKTAFTIDPLVVSDLRSSYDMWYGQMQLWIQQDLAYAIAEENADSKDVFSSPVKRLISMQVPMPPMYSFPPPTPGGTSSGGVPASGKDTDAILSIYTVSVTGRYSNGMYDVVPFRLVVDVDSTKVNHFLETLSHQRLITVTNQNTYALDTDVESGIGYLYGSAAPVRLEIEGEILFMRSWTQALMPDTIKQALGLMAPPAGQTPGQVPGGMPGGMPSRFPTPPGGMGYPPMR